MSTVEWLEAGLMGVACVRLCTESRGTNEGRREAQEAGRAACIGWGEDELTGRAKQRTHKQETMLRGETARCVCVFSAQAGCHRCGAMTEWPNCKGATTRSHLQRVLVSHGRRAIQLLQQLLLTLIFCRPWGIATGTSLQWRTHSCKRMSGLRGMVAETCRGSKGVAFW